VSPEPAATVDLAGIRGRCRPIDDGHGFGQRGRTSMVTFGPRWGGLREHLMGEGEELALIGAPGSPAEPGFVLEPALLDVATAFGRGRGAGTYLPLGYGRVVVRSALPATFYSHLRYQDSGGDQVVAADLTLCDESGRVLVEVYDFVLRRVDQDAVAGGLATAGTAADGAATAAPATAAPEGLALEGPALEAAAPEAAALEAIAGPGGLSGLGGPAASGGAAGPDGAASPAPSGMIRPADGAEAFRRALAGDLGPRIVISRVPVADLFARRVTATELAGTAEAGAVGTAEAGAVGTAEAGATGIDGAGAVDTAGDADYAPPRTELETVLADLWSKVLGIDRVGVHQDFFALGGNSLVAVQLIAQARKATGVRLPMRVLFDAPTVAELAVHIQELGSGGSGPETTIPRLSR
jgi:acyl carrier protein